MIKNFVIGILIILVLYLWLYDGGRTKPTVQINYDSVKIYRQGQRLAEQRGRELEIKMAADELQDSLEHAEDSIKLNVQAVIIKRLNKSPKVITVLKENPEVDSLVTALDSANTLLTIRVDSLQGEKERQKKDFEARLVFKDEELMAERAITGQYIQANLKLEKKLRQTKRKGLLGWLANVGSFFAGRASK